MVKARIMIIKTGGGVSCAHCIDSIDQEQDQDIVLVCETCSDAFLAGYEVAVSGTIKNFGKRLESVCPHVFRLLQLPFKDGGAKWLQQGNALLCADCAKKKDEALK